MMMRSLLALSAILAGSLVPSLATAAPTVDSNTFGALRARAIGPAVMSGRIASIDAVATDPVTLWVGTASGGVWRSEDGGTTFEAVFDDYTQSIGAVRVAPSDPETIWVGTGESWTRNSVSIGEGVWKSTDGGENWQKVGLEESERIGAIRIHPEDPDVVFVCAVGHLFDENEERGVFKTTDGGETWKKVLYVDEKTGCADLDIDPQEPDILYAAMWQVRRWAHFFESGGPGSGLYRSMDGGETWSELEDGLPEGELGRIAVAVAPSRPNVVYATVEAEETALYRSDDLGGSWRKMNASQNVQMRPFYFSELVIDPTDHERVYKPGFTLTVSSDGGESFTSMLGGGFSFSVHPDHHALWINPENPHELVLGTDGGVYISYDRADSWNHIKTLPVSQFYQVAADDEVPYNVYGGLQDNGSWMGPSRASGGVPNSAWEMLSFGDGFWVLPDPNDSNIAYSESQGGNLFRADKKLGVTKVIFPYPKGDEEELRFNWNTPMHLSPTTPGTLYYGSQYLHRSRDRGETWETISPDLTTDDPEKQRQKESGGITTDNSTAENHCTIYSISESPKNGDVIWVGTDDGNVQVTRDGGETWTNVVSNVPDLGPESWVSSVHASPHDEATAFATFDRHWHGDMAPYAYKTTDFGATWTSLLPSAAGESAGDGADGDGAANDGAVDDGAVDGYAHVIEQDPVNPNLLFLGTEFGLFLSLDGGEQWARFKGSLPRVAVHDVYVHPHDRDLVVATHGRGVYVIDDLTPLRALTVEALADKVVMLPSRPAEMVIGGGVAFGMGSDDEFVGEVPQEAAYVTYYLSRRHLFGDLKVEVYDQDDRLLATIPGGKRKGINRVAWPMRYKAPNLPAATNLVPAFQGPVVLEGEYKVKLVKGKDEYWSRVELVPDRRNPYSKDERLEQQKTALELYDALEHLSFLVAQLEKIRETAAERAESDELRQRDKKQVAAIGEKAEDLRTTLVSTEEAGWLSGDTKLREDLGTLYGAVAGYHGPPTGSQKDELEHLLGELEEAAAKVEKIAGAELTAVNETLEKRGLDTIEPFDRDSWMAENSGKGASAAAMLSSKKGRHLLQQRLFRLWGGL